MPSASWISLHVAFVSVFLSCTYHIAFGYRFRLFAGVCFGVYRSAVHPSDTGAEEDLGVYIQSDVQPGAYLQHHSGNDYLSGSKGLELQFLYGTGIDFSVCRDADGKGGLAGKEKPTKTVTHGRFEITHTTVVAAAERTGVRQGACHRAVAAFCRGRREYLFAGTSGSGEEYGGTPPEAGFPRGRGFRVFDVALQYAR